MLPNFLIIGAQKAGTTSLFQYLLRNNNIAEPIVKEVHYFDFNYYKGIDWYKSHFSIKSSRITGEASPYYMFCSQSISRIHNTLGENLKIIVLLRNPYDRAVSQYKHYQKKGFDMSIYDNIFNSENKNVESNLHEILRHEIDLYNRNSYSSRVYSCLLRSHYQFQLDRLDLFYRDKYLLIISEDMFDNPKAKVRNTLEYLGQSFHTQDEYPVYNKSKSSNDQQNEYIRKYLLEVNMNVIKKHNINRWL